MFRKFLRWVFSPHFETLVEENKRLHEINCKLVEQVEDLMSSCVVDKEAKRAIRFKKVFSFVRKDLEKYTYGRKALDKLDKLAREVD